MKGNLIQVMIKLYYACTFKACFRDRVPELSLIDKRPFTVLAFIIFSSTEIFLESSSVVSVSLFMLANAASTMGSKIDI